MKNSLKTNRSIIFFAACFSAACLMLLGCLSPEEKKMAFFTKGEALLVPFFCDVFIGEAISWTGDRESFMSRLDDQLQQLSAEGEFPDWE